MNQKINDLPNVCISVHESKRKYKLPVSVKVPFFSPSSDLLKATINTQSMLEFYRCRWSVEGVLGLQDKSSEEAVSVQQDDMEAHSAVPVWVSSV